eukprot:SAG22_NODE_1085_length_5632_cov_40.777697_5_plen_108_part_00
MVAAQATHDPDRSLLFDLLGGHHLHAGAAQPVEVLPVALAQRPDLSQGTALDKTLAEARQKDSAFASRTSFSTAAARRVGSCAALRARSQSSSSWVRIDFLTDGSDR